MLRASILVALICASCGDIQPSQAVETLTVNSSRPTTVINIKDDATSATTATNTKEPATTDTNMNVTPLNVMTAAAATSTDQVIDSNNNSKNKKNNNMHMNNVVSNMKEDEENERLYYHPAEDKKPRVVEEYSRHFLDGSYEYKYVLSNGVSRYEKSYWKLVAGNTKILARMGFYSHPLKNGKFLTVFYTADENGYLQDTAQYTNGVPTLPKYLDIPQMEIPKETTTATISTIPPKPATTSTTRKPKTTTTTWRPVVKPSEFNWIY